MSIKQKLKDYCKQLNIDYVGIASIGPYEELEKILKARIEKGYFTGFEEQNIQKRIDPRQTMPEAKSIIVCLFPYFTSPMKNSNIAKYAHGKDYHRLVKDKLGKIGEFLSEQIEDFKYQAYVDTGPLADRYVAYLAGLGYFGLHSQIINDEYGSYVLIGYILNNHAFEGDKPLEKNCQQCGLCVEACPGEAIEKEGIINPQKCLSFITQKKEELTAEEIKALKENKTIFGCDVCQDVCPHNQRIKSTPLEEFYKDLITELKEEELSQLSNKEFKKKYGDRAFAWRGKKLLVRNFEIKR